MKKVILIAGLLASASFGSFSVAQNGQSLNAIPQSAAPFTSPTTVLQDLARIDASLNATTTFQGDFIQVAPDGGTASGKVWLQRPGKVRFEYNEPNPLLIVSDGVTFVQHDRQLDTYDRVPLKATPLNYFLKENVNLAEDTEVVALQKFDGAWRVSARDGSGEQEGTITMVFDGQNLALKEWIISDNFGGHTRVILSNLQYNGRIDPRLFIQREDSNRRRQ